MSKDGKRSPKARKRIDISVANDWPTSRREKLRAAAERDWKRSLPTIVKGFLSFFNQHPSKNFATVPFKICLSKKKLTKRQQELLLESGTAMYAAVLASMNKHARARFAEWKRNYEKALFGKLRHSDQKRAAFEFLRNWHNAQIHDLESGADVETVTFTVPLRIIYLAPLLAALKRCDRIFFDGLAEALYDLESYGEKDPRDKWLIEHEWEIENLTPREIKELFGPKFQTTSVRKLHERLNYLGLQHRHEPSGQASPSYRQFRRAG
jgi:hypothetical protein